MATQKPISTISYNNESFLREKLETWRAAHIIQTYQYIKHKGEDGDKDHIHLRIEPNKRIDPMELAESLKEYPFNSTSNKPLGVRPFRPSVEEDWYLYVVHDEEYMKLKYQSDKSEKLPYSWSDIVAPDDYDVEIAFVRAKAKMKHSNASLISRLLSGESSFRLIADGENPFFVNAIVHSLAQDDYSRLLDDYNELNNKLSHIQKAIENAGFDLVLDDDGNFSLESVKK